MWIATNKGFYSIVQDRNDHGRVVVRARHRDHLVEFFDGIHHAKIIETTDSDYRFRCFVTRHISDQAVMRALSEIDYENFKNSVKDNALHNAYLKIWSAMFNYQSDMYPGSAWWYHGDRFRN